MTPSTRTAQRWKVQQSLRPAYLNKVPYLIVRAISDKADDSAHMDYGEFEAKAVEHSVNLMLALVKRI